MEKVNEVTEIMEKVLKLSDKEKRELLLVMRGMELQRTAVQLQQLTA